MFLYVYVEEERKHYQKQELVQIMKDKCILLKKKVKSR